MENYRKSQIMISKKRDNLIQRKTKRNKELTKFGARDRQNKMRKERERKRGRDRYVFLYKVSRCDLLRGGPASWLNTH